MPNTPRRTLRPLNQQQGGQTRPPIIAPSVQNAQTGGNSNSQVPQNQPPAAPGTQPPAPNQTNRPAATWTTLPINVPNQPAPQNPSNPNNQPIQPTQPVVRNVAPAGQPSSGSNSPLDNIAQIYQDHRGKILLALAAIAVATAGIASRIYRNPGPSGPVVDIAQMARESAQRNPTCIGQPVQSVPNVPVSLSIVSSGADTRLAISGPGTLIANTCGSAETARFVPVQPSTIRGKVVAGVAVCIGGNVFIDSGNVPEVDVKTGSLSTTLSFVPYTGVQNPCD